MDSIKKPLEDLLISIETLGKTQVEIIKLKSIKTASIFVSSMIIWITIFITVIISLIFTGIASALYLGDILNNKIWGFLIVSLAFIVLGILSALIMSKTIKKSVGKYLIKTTLNQ